HRSAAGAHSLGAHPGPAAAVRSTSFAVYGSHPKSAHDCELVRTALAGGGDLSGSTTNPRGGNPAPMGGARHRPDYAVFAGTVFFGNAAGRSTRPPKHPAPSAGCLVPQGAAHVCRCARGSASAVLEAEGFSSVPSPRPCGKTSPSSAGVLDLCSVPCGLMAKVELRGCPRRVRLFVFGARVWLVPFSGGAGDGSSPDR